MIFFTIEYQMKHLNSTEVVSKLKEIEALLKLSVGEIMTEDKATDIYAITNELMCQFSELRQEKKHSERYFLDVRVGCAAVRDSWHESYNDTYPGLHSYMEDVVSYKHGKQNSDKNSWEMNSEDIEYLQELCKKMNAETKT